MSAQEPLPIPPNAAAAAPAGRRGLSMKVIVLTVAAGVAGAATSFAIMLPKMRETERRTTCMKNLLELSHVYFEDMLENGPKARRWSGPAMWLSRRQRGAESRLLCPEDATVRSPVTDADRAAWDDANLADPRRDLCSYAGRDFANFPIDSCRNAIGACVHHRGGVIVAFDIGDVRFFTREQLGISEDDEIRCGPESASPLLRMLVGGN